MWCRVESTVKCAALDCVSSLKTEAILVIYEVNPYFLFVRGTQMGGGRMGRGQADTELKQISVCGNAMSLQF